MVELRCYYCGGPGTEVCSDCYDKILCECTFCDTVELGSKMYMSTMSGDVYCQDCNDLKGREWQIASFLIDFAQSVDGGCNTK